MTRFCTNCGKEVADGIVFCTSCGARMTEAVQPIQTGADTQAQQAGCQNAAADQQWQQAGYQNTAADQQWQQAGYQNTAADQQWQQAGYQNAAADQQWSQGQQYDRQPYTTVPPYNQPPVYPIPQAVTEMNTKVGTFTYFGLILLFAIPVIGWIACLVMCFSSKNDSIKSFARAVLIWLIIGVAFAVVSGIIIIVALNRLLDFVQSQLGELANIKDLISQFTQFDLSSFGMDGLDMESLMEGYDLTGIPIE